MSFLKPDETFAVIKEEYTGTIKQFRMLCEMSFEEYDIYSKDKSRIYSAFGGIDNIIKKYKEGITEEEKYYFEVLLRSKCNDLESFFSDHVYCKPYRFHKERKMVIHLGFNNLHFRFQDEELDRAGDIETLLKQRKLQKNIQGF